MKSTLKTLLGLTALTAFLGLFPFALAESKPSSTTTKAPSAKPSAEAAQKLNSSRAARRGRRDSSSVAPRRVASGSSERSPVASRTKKAAQAPRKIATAARASRDSTPPPSKTRLTPTQESKLLALLNQGSTDDLVALPGIAATRAGALVAARPFDKIHEIIRVDGIGQATYERLLAHGKK